MSDVCPSRPRWLPLVASLVLLAGCLVCPFTIGSQSMALIVTGAMAMALLVVPICLAMWVQNG